MPGTRNTYIEGLDRDTSYEKYSNKKYYNARNFKITTEDELSTGSLETEKGNAFKFKIPNVTSSKIITENIIPSGGYNNTTIYINGHTETGVSFSDLSSLKSKIESLYSSEIKKGDFTLVEDQGILYFIGLDARDFYSDGSNPSMAVNIGDENMDPSTGNNTSWGGPLGQFYPTQSDLKICGWGTIRDQIILFTTNSESKNPSSYGQIWLISYDPTSNSIDEVDQNGFLLPSKALIVCAKFNFSLYYRIGEVIGRYENQNIGRVYWTDNYNPPSSFNLFDPKSYIVPASNANIKGNVRLSQPMIESVGSGNLPVGSTVQYTYRLRDSQGGNQTTFAPLSNMINLTDADPNSDNYQDYGGANKGEVKNSKAVNYKIPYVDNTYDVIEHIVVIYEKPGDPKVWKYEEEFTGSVTTLKKTNTDIPNDATSITFQEFNKVNTTPNRVKTMDVKDNMLIWGNVRSAPFDPGLDTRAYRFNSDRFARGFSIQDMPVDVSSPEFTIDGSNPNWNVPGDADAINPYNYDENIWDYSISYLHGLQEPFSYTYKYKADGSTLGGEGPNISYEFTFEPLRADDLSRPAPSGGSEPYIDVDKIDTSYNFGVTDRKGNPLNYDLNNEFFSQKSPIIESILTGYTRGEVYRFGITFYDNAGTPSYVKWIGDIRFPFHHEINIGDYVNSNHQILGIKFTVDISSIRDQISGFSIMRVERTDSDITRLETGLTAPLYYIYSNNAESEFKNILGAKIGNTNYSSVDSLALDPGEPQGIDDARHANWRKECFYSGAAGHFPELDNIAEDIDYAEFVSRYHTFGSNSDVTTTQNTIARMDKTVVADFNSSDHLDSNKAGLRIDVENAKVMNFGESLENISTFPYPVLNNAWTRHALSGDPIEEEFQDSLGDRKLVINYSLSPHPYWVPYVDDHTYIFATLGRKRTVEFGQYGGDSFEDRSNQEYIRAGEFQIVDRLTPSQFTLDTFGGDTYNFYYDFQVMFRNYSKDGSNVSDGDGHYKINQTIAHSLETPLNTGLRDKGDSTFNNFAKEGFVSSPSSTLDLASNTEFNDVYLQENSARQVYRSEDVLANFVEEHTHQLRASRQKIDGELVDSWRDFPPAQTIEVEGTRGPINKVINFKDTIYFLQSSGFGAVSINERSTLQSEQGNEITLGYGGVLDDYRYISTQTGTIHQYSVEDSGSAIFYVDALNKKIMRFGANGNSPLSDIKGLSSFLDDKIEGYIEERDNTLTFPISHPQLNINEEDHPIGIVSIFDRRHNRMFFTFLAGDYEETGDLVHIGDKDSRLIKEYEWNDKSFTVSYSEKLAAFESFYDFRPSLYLAKDHKVFSVDPSNKKDVYEHEEGKVGTFYGTTYPSEINIIVNEKANVPKVFTNLEINAQSKDGNTDNWDDIVDRIEVYNDYQDSGEVPLNIDSNIQRRFRKWRMQIPRSNHPTSLNYNPNLEDDHRIRGPWCHIRLIYENDQGYRFILHNIETYFLEKPY